MTAGEVFVQLSTMLTPRAGDERHGASGRRSGEESSRAKLIQAQKLRRSLDKENIDRLVRTRPLRLRLPSPPAPPSSRRAADRDHCVQYMIAVPLIFGRLTAADYEDGVAADPRIDALRSKVYTEEDRSGHFCPMSSM